MLDFIIIGCGVAGINLAMHLKELGLKIAVLDDAQKTCSSLVAAGALNPVTGKRMVKSWFAEYAMPYANNYYPKLEGAFSANFFRKTRILQVCKSQEENALWHTRHDDEAYAPFLRGSLPPNTLKTIKDPFGAFYIENVSKVQTEVFCAAARKYLQSQNLYFLRDFDFEKIEVCESFVRYEDFTAKAAVFCEGYRAMANPFFYWLPFSPAKGEILELKGTVELPPEIIHKEKWLIRLSENTFRCGSTWDRQNFNQQPTKEGEAEILKAVKLVLKDCPELEVLSHTAGVRPCTRTTRPFLGTHPKLKNLHIFNGFGSKGYALTPFFADMFAKYLTKNTPIEPQADIARHIRKFFRE